MFAVDVRMAATLFVQPLDLVKNRMQLSGEFSLLFVTYVSIALCNILILELETE